MHLGGRHIFVKCLRLGGWAAPRATGQNFHDPNVIGLLKRQNIPGPDGPCRLDSRLALDADLAPGYHPGSQRARFEKPRLPEPFIEADCFAPFTQPLLNPAKAAAKGLSGSIFFSTFGFALNF